MRVYQHLWYVSLGQRKSSLCVDFGIVQCVQGELEKFSSSIRQRVSHKRTFLYLEQLILKHGAHRGCLSVQTFRDGMVFYFADKQKTARFISFL